MRIAIYVRKSTESEDRQVQSLDDQLHILQEIAVRDGYSVVEIISESKSAKEPGQRPGFKALIELIESGKIEGILTWHINRLTRNLVDGGQIAHLLSSGKLQIIRTPERIFRSEDNVLLLAIENGVATSYIHDLSKAVRRGMDSKAAKGWKPGQAPIGYLNDWESREIILDPIRAPFVKKGFDMLNSGSYSVAEIWRELSRLGLTGKSKSRKGKPVSKVSIHTMLRNRFYVGELSYKGDLSRGSQEPIVTKGEFELAQIRLNRLTNPKHRTDSPPAFAGVFKCRACGAAVVFERKVKRLAKTGEVVNYGYYHCSGSRGCKRISIPQQHVSDLCREFVDNLRVSPSFAQWCSTAVLNAIELDQSALGESKNETKLNLDENIRRLDSLTMKYVDGEVDRDTYGRMKISIETKIAERKAVLKRLENQDYIISEHIRQKLNAGVQANFYGGGNASFRRTVITSLGCGHFLDGRQLAFRADPVLQKIASFEPGSRSSQSAKSDDFVPDHQVWWTLVEDIRITALEALHEQSPIGSSHTKTDPLSHAS